jgi:hypothetical protein
MKGLQSQNDRARNDFTPGSALLIMDSISAAQIKTEVKKFWDAFASKSKSGFQDLYSPTATAMAVVVNPDD